MSKSDLKARPIFHHQKDAIEAHLTVVMASLAIGRSMEKKTGLSVNRLIKVLKPIRSGKVIIAGMEIQADAKVPVAIIPILRKLKRDTN
jgi:transposase